MGDLSKHPVVDIRNAFGASPVVLVCEHASNFFPESYQSLGLSADARDSHAAWDPGALGVARKMASRLDARLVACGVSRLIYDCNRPPEAPSAIPEQSEIHTVPGNQNLTAAQRQARVDTIYTPFHRAVDRAMDGVDGPVLVTIHSFTPVFMGQPRKVEIGILHDTDRRLADRMLDCAPVHTGLVVQRNAPYGPQDGVTHTLQRHGIARSRLNVMLEVRNDLIRTPAEQERMGIMLADWVKEGVARVHKDWVHSC